MHNLEKQLLVLSLVGTSPSVDLPNVTTPIDLLLLGNPLEALKRALQTLVSSEKGGRDKQPETLLEWFGYMDELIGECLVTEEYKEDKVWLLFSIAVSSTLLFVMENLTGPSQTIPPCPFDVLADEAAMVDPSSRRSGAEFGEDTTTPGDAWAATLLTENGEDLIGKLPLVQYLVLAKRIFLAPLRVFLLPNEQDGSSARLQPFQWLQKLSSWTWWAGRVVLLQQRSLSARSAVLKCILSALNQNTSLYFDSIQKNGSYTTEDKLLHASFLLECTLCHIAYGRADSAAEDALKAACKLMAFDAHLTGVVGVRTAHQLDSHAQLVLTTKRENMNLTQDIKNSIDTHQTESHILDSLVCEGRTSPEFEGLTMNENDILKHPRLDENNSEYTLTKDLTTVEQALILGLATVLKSGSSSDALQPWEVAAHVEAIECQERSQFMLKAAAALQASRVERSRPRTRERALLRLESLANGMGSSSLESQSHQRWSSPLFRLPCAFAVWFPLQSSLRREQGEALIAAGLVGAALDLFEKLELWDGLIVCYRLLDKKVAAEKLIKKRLEVAPNEPRLWCALGDITDDRRHYSKAWECSGNRNARSARSLAKCALRAEEYELAADYYAAALNLSPLQEETWFNYGYCCMKSDKEDEALRGFSRCAHLEPENGEAWNNLAVVHMKNERWSEAYAALTEAVKHKRDSWQTWDNYAKVSTLSGHWQAATRALSEVVSLTHGRRLDFEVLEKLISHFERGDDVPLEEKRATVETAEEAELKLASTLGELYTSEDEGNGKWQAEVQAVASRKRGALEKLISSLMKQIASTASGESAFWGLYARYYTATGYPEAAMECQIKRVRSLQGSRWQHDEPAFEEYGKASLELCQSYLKSGSARDLGAARMHLRSTIKQAQDRYEDAALFAELKCLLRAVEEKTPAKH